MPRLTGKLLHFNSYLDICNYVVDKLNEFPNNSAISGIILAVKIYYIFGDWISIYIYVLELSELIKLYKTNSGSETIEANTILGTFDHK